MSCYLLIYLTIVKHIQYHQERHITFSLLFFVKKKNQSYWFHLIMKFQHDFTITIVNYVGVYNGLYNIFFNKGLIACCL